MKIAHKERSHTLLKTVFTIGGGAVGALAFHYFVGEPSHYINMYALRYGVSGLATTGFSLQNAEYVLDGITPYAASATFGGTLGYLAAKGISGISKKE